MTTKEWNPIKELQNGLDIRTQRGSTMLSTEDVTAHP